MSKRQQFNEYLIALRYTGLRGFVNHWAERRCVAYIRDVCVREKKDAPWRRLLFKAVSKIEWWTRPKPKKELG